MLLLWHNQLKIEDNEKINEQKMEVKKLHLALGVDGADTAAIFHAESDECGWFGNPHL